MKKQSFKKQIGKRENMIYDELLDEYTCHNNKKLKFIKTKKRKSKSGYESFIKIYEGESCEGCELKSKCTRAKGNRQLHVSPLLLKNAKLRLKRA